MKFAKEYETEVYVSATNMVVIHQNNDDTDAESIPVVFTPQRAREVAAAMLAMADEAQALIEKANAANLADTDQAEGRRNGR